MSVYREYAPRPELRDHVRALFWFGPVCDGGPRPATRELFFGARDLPFAPIFADAHASILFELGSSYDGNGKWLTSDACRATVMGPVTRASHSPVAGRPAVIGVYLRPRGGAELLGIPALELTDRILALPDLWKRFEHDPRGSTIESVEAELMRRLNAGRERIVRIAALASHVRHAGGRVSVEDMARLAGVSRQHLARLFGEYIGVSPKLYARLARFGAGLHYVASHDARRNWSDVAARLGYADQSHLIAEFREFSTMTPEQLARGERFHPFVASD